MKTKVYFAGKIDRMDWRHDILPFLQAVDYPVLEKVARDNPCLKEIPIKGTPFIYTGPYFISEGGHGLYHGENTHGAMSECGDERTFPYHGDELLLTTDT